MPAKKWNTENVKRFIEDNSESTLISEYENWDTSIKLLCKCGKEFETFIQHIKAGKLQCNTCGKNIYLSKMRTSFEKIKAELELITRSSLLTSEKDFEHEISVNKKAPSAVGFVLTCPQCKVEHITGTYNKIKNMKQHICYSCFLFNQSKEIYKRIKKFVEVDSASGCKLLSKSYMRQQDKLDFRCVCGKEFQVTYAKFKNGNKRTCNVCSEKVRRDKLKSYIYEEIADVVSSRNCIILTKKKDYDNVNSILWLAGSCNHIFQISFKEFVKRKSNKCLECTSVDWDTKKIREWIKKNAFGFQMKNKSYSNYDKKLTFTCPENHTFKKRWNHFLRGERCSVCTSSAGEQAIHCFFVQNKILYKRQFTFDKCKNEKPLPFDFAVFYKNGNVKALIEYDGQQHFQPVDFGDMTKSEAEVVFKERQRLDKIKNDYCESNNIKLIRIPYWDFNNIETILYENLMEVKELAFNVK